MRKNFKTRLKKHETHESVQYKNCLLSNAKL